MAPKKGKKANADQWPVSFSPLRKKIAKKKRESLDFSGSSSDEDDQSSTLLKLPALETGTVLEACNGSDIQLSRGASVRPNLAKGRGRYLIILPGIMSFKTLAKQAPNPSPEMIGSKAESADAKGKQDDENGDSEEEEKKSERSVEDSGDKKPAAKRNPFAPRVTMLGKIEEIESDTPIMKVPFDDGRSLVFQGKKVDTSSKYMMLNCKASKGSVTCKDMFSSAIVFGEAQWEGKASTQDSDESEEDEEQVDPDAPFRHYGGSNRTCDGAVLGTALKQLQRKRAAKPRASMTSTSMEGSDIEMLDDDDESEEDIAMKETPPPRAPRPKRRASSQKKIEIPESDEESDEDEESEASNVDMKDAPPPARAPTQKRKASSQKKTDIPKGSEESEDDFDIDIKDTPPPRAPRQRRSASSKTTIEIPDSEEEEDESDSDVEIVQAPPPRASKGKRKSASQSKVKADNEKENNREAEDILIQPSKTKQKAAPKAKKAPVAKRKAASQKKTPVAAKRAKKEESDDELSFGSSSSSEIIVVDKDDDEDYMSPGESKKVVAPRGTPRSSRARRLAKLGLQSPARKLNEDNTKVKEGEGSSDDEAAAAGGDSDESEYEE